MRAMALRKTVDAQIRTHSEAEIEEVVKSVLPLFPGINREEFTQRLRAHLAEEFDQIDREVEHREITSDDVR